MWIKRDFEAVLSSVVRQRPAIVLTGGRQTGKTSLIKHLFPNWNFISLDLPSDADLADNDPDTFLRKNPPPLIIDEVQYSPRIFRHIKHLIDRSRDKYGQFILTGSQKFVLMKEVADTLAGRVDIFELPPLSVSELDATIETDEALLIRGGFPELHAQPELDATRFYRSYVATYLERDLRAVLNVSHLRDFERFIRACAFRSGQLLNKSELARDVGISTSTANAWLSALEATNQIILLEPWFANRTRSLVKSPKLYFTDTGLLSFLLNITSVEDLLSSPFAGNLWETFVCCEIRKQLNLTAEVDSLYFWRDRSHEVDFMIHRGGRVSFIESKWSQHPGVSHFAAIEKVEARLSKRMVVENRSVICRTKKQSALPAGEVHSIRSWVAARRASRRS